MLSIIPAFKLYKLTFHLGIGFNRGSFGIPMKNRMLLVTIGEKS